MASPIRIATRKSQLALWQANWTQAELEKLGHSAELVLIDTEGDKTQAANQSFASMQGQGFFTKAVQEALLDGRADLAVHSHKDLPSMTHIDLEVAAVTKRADARDILLINPNAHSANMQNLPLKTGMKVGTSAVRRQKQLTQLRPDLITQELRGNVPTRIQKLREGHYDAIMLAAAGIDRLELDLSEFLSLKLEPDLFVPAPAQGALALECRRRDYELASILTDLHDIATYKAIAAERGLMAMLHGGCQLALGAYAEFQGGSISLKAWYEGKFVTCTHPSSEGVAMLTFDALGRPTVTPEGQSEDS